MGLPPPFSGSACSLPEIYVVGEWRKKPAEVTSTDRSVAKGTATFRSSLQDGKRWYARFERRPVVLVRWVVGWLRIWTRWWFQIFFFTPTWENDPNWLIFFKWVETTSEEVDWLGGWVSKKKSKRIKKNIKGIKKNYSTFTPVMLFTQSPGSSCGHFQHCVSTTHMKTSPSSFRPFGFHWSMKGAGAGDDLWPISPTIPFLAQASSQSEPVPSTQLETPSPVPSTQLETLSSPELACKHHEAHPLASPASNVALGPASSPKRSGKHEFGVGHAFDLTQCLCVQQADHPSKVACSPEISSRHMCQVCHECLCLLPRVGNPCNVGTASAACSIVRELDTDCGSSNAVPAPVFVFCSRASLWEKVTRTARAGCS